MFESFEKETKKQFHKSSFAKTANGEISFDLDWGTVGTSGKLTGGRFKKKDMWAMDFFDSVNWDANNRLLELYETSKNHAEGPVYKLIIRFEKGQAKFNYYFENSEIRSLSDIAKDSHGTYPLFAYRSYFTEELIEVSQQGDLRIGHQALIERLLTKELEIPEHHMEFYALNDFISDFYNGGLNQYFARSITWDSAQYARVDLYPRLREALTKLGRKDLKAMFDEAIALYAHYNEHVEEAREKLNIPAVSKQEESNIGSRFWEIIDDLESETESYIKTNKSIFAYH